MYLAFLILTISNWSHMFLQVKYVIAIIIFTHSKSVLNIRNKTIINFWWNTECVFYLLYRRLLSILIDSQCTCDDWQLHKCCLDSGFVCKLWSLSEFCSKGCIFMKYIHIFIKQEENKEVAAFSQNITRPWLGSSVG